MKQKIISKLEAEGMVIRLRDVGIIGDFEAKNIFKRIDFKRRRGLI